MKYVIKRATHLEWMVKQTQSTAINQFNTHTHTRRGNERAFKRTDALMRMCDCLVCF